ncbi:MAG: threonine--tRNA ligase [Bacteroidetes bacterium QS_9_68_14]|nr:MAG: threonine--tRNA ligase [Bacteroidetes bacterium QS_9_68_14]
MSDAATDPQIEKQRITLTLPDGSERTHPEGTTGLEATRDIGAGLARDALAVKVDGEVRDLQRPIEQDADFAVLTWDDAEGKMVFWHSSAHLLAEALEDLYGDVKFGVGPPIEDGFYYDVDFSESSRDAPSDDDDLAEIEDKMQELAARDVPYERRPVSKEEAMQYFREKGDPYKQELIEELPDEEGAITFYQQGGFTDLCRGPHLPSTGPVTYPKLLSTAGAYWRGDETRAQLTRIYGVSFPKKKLLDEPLEMLEEARERDHRKLGRELDLFTFSEKVGAGLPMWLPKGTVLRETLEGFLQQEQVERGYEPVVTPHIGRLDLYRTSGHYPYYQNSQFPPILERNRTGRTAADAANTPPEVDGHASDEDAGDAGGSGAGEGDEQGYLLKPMNCPHHVMIYKNKLHSYRDLPVRLAEFGTVYRHEQSGELGGLTRVRGFTQDDAHVFCTPAQVKAEFKDVIDLTLKVLDALDFDAFQAQLSLRDPDDAEQYVGGAEKWDAAEDAIREAAAEMGLVAQEGVGEAAFYGPKLDFMVQDALGREWQLGTVQLDYNLPERFDLEYVGADDDRHRPVMIHRAPFGSLERFIGVLIEHCGGDFPLWLAPEQVRVLPVGDDFHGYARDVQATLHGKDLRAKVDDSDATVGYKIREAETQKVPFMLIVGEREEEAGTVAVRRHGEGQQDTMPLEDFAERVAEEVEAQVG